MKKVTNPPNRPTDADLPDTADPEALDPRPVYVELPDGRRVPPPPPTSPGIDARGKKAALEAEASIYTPKPEKLGKSPLDPGGPPRTPPGADDSPVRPGIAGDEVDYPTKHRPNGQEDDWADPESYDLSPSTGPEPERLTVDQLMAVGNVVSASHDLVVGRPDGDRWTLQVEHAVAVAVDMLGADSRPWFATAEAGWLAPEAAAFVVQGGNVVTTVEAIVVQHPGDRFDLSGVRHLIGDAAYRALVGRHRNATGARPTFIEPASPTVSDPTVLPSDVVDYFDRIDAAG